MGRKIAVSLEKCLKQLNPMMILQDRSGKKHRARNWSRYLPKSLLKKNASIESDIYNEGRLEVHVWPVGNYTLLQAPLTEFRREHF